MFAASAIERWRCIYPVADDLTVTYGIPKGTVLKVISSKEPGTDYAVTQYECSCRVDGEHLKEYKGLSSNREALKEALYF